MNLDDLGDFPRSPPYFGYNSAGSENPVLCIFWFQGPIRTQIDRGFFEDQYFPKYDDTRLWNEEKGARRRDIHQVARPPPWARHYGDWAPWASPGPLQNSKSVLLT